MPTQKRNSNMVDLLRPDYQARNEPNFAIANAASTYLSLAFLRGYWPGSSFDSANNVYDISGQGRTLSSVSFGGGGISGLAPYIAFNGATDYLLRASETDLQGGTALTLGGWFYFNGAAAAIEQCMTKLGSVGNYGYALRRLANGMADFTVSSDGTIVFAATSTVICTAAGWNFIAGRYTANTELSVFLNGVKYTNVAGIPAGVFASVAQFRIGAYNPAAGGILPLAGRASNWFLCQGVLTDTVINNIYEQTRAAYGR